MADSTRFSLPARPVMPPGSALTRNRPMLAKLQKPRQPQGDDHNSLSTTPKTPPAPPPFLPNNTMIYSRAFRRDMPDPKPISSVSQKSSRQTAMRINKKRAKTRPLAYTLSEDLTNAALVMKIKLMVLAGIPRLYLRDMKMAACQQEIYHPEIVRLACMASTDHNLRYLMTRVAQGVANNRELACFRRIVDQVLLELRYGITNAIPCSIVRYAS
ncbi:hypothetical protein F5Y10DRAFT_233888 [Nemania abortiva]|nr:hypothetical protein F5Y10DRAFT_233888 [Nemania abortiva]